jgi:hypothetical protein
MRIQTSKAKVDDNAEKSIAVINHDNLTLMTVICLSGYN